MKCGVEMVKMDLDIHYEKADAELVKRFHEADLKVNVWTVDDPVAFKKMQEIGVDYITTNKLFPQPLTK